MIIGVSALFGATLTLPGIAGLVLTLGMAVDANVIIYERIREELRAGKALRAAITDGYKNAYSAIIDGNLTTIITGIVLFAFGSGPVQGFATTLVIGIITSFLTSVFITRLVFEARLAKNKNITFESNVSRNFLQNTNFNFLKASKATLTTSAIVCVVCLGFMFTKGFTYGVDFTGGRTFVLRFDKEVVAEDVRQAANAEFGETVEVKQFGGASQMKVTTKYKIADNSTEVDAEVEAKLYNALKGFFADDMTLDEFISTQDNPNGIVSSDKIGPAIAKDMTMGAIFSLLFGAPSIRKSLPER